MKEIEAQYRQFTDALKKVNGKSYDAVNKIFKEQNSDKSSSTMLLNNLGKFIKHHSREKNEEFTDLSSADTPDAIISHKRLETKKSSKLNQGSTAVTNNDHSNTIALRGFLCLLLAFYIEDYKKDLNIKNTFLKVTGKFKDLKTESLKCLPNIAKCIIDTKAEQDRQNRLMVSVFLAGIPIGIACSYHMYRQEIYNLKPSSDCIINLAFLPIFAGIAAYMYFYPEQPKGFDRSFIDALDKLNKLILSCKEYNDTTKSTSGTKNQLDASKIF